MLDYENWLENYVPVYEEQQAVENTTIFRIKKDSNGQPVQLLLKDKWYDILSPIFELVHLSNSIELTTPLGISVVYRVREQIENLVINLESWGIPIVISIIGLGYYLADKAISLGKFTYKTYGWGEGPFGKGPYGGGTVAHELPPDEN